MQGERTVKGKARAGTLARLHGRLRSAAGRFRRDERAAVAIMAAFTIISSTVIMGGAIDIYRYEMVRKKAQNTLDRAVLSASALSQKITDSREIVESYMKSAGLELPANAEFVSCPADGMDTCCALEVNPDACKADWANYARTYRSMSVRALYPVPLTFLRLSGLNEWEVEVLSSAVERERKVEVSLVLDMSGSMGSNVRGESQRRIDKLKPAAEDFIDRMLGTDKAKDLTTISIVPYAGQVSLGREMFDFLAGPGYKRGQDYSSCFHLEKGDFTAGVPNFSRRKHVDAFTFGASHDGREYSWQRRRSRWTPNTRYPKNSKVNGEWIVNSSPFHCPSDAYVYWRGNKDEFKLRWHGKGRDRWLSHDERFDLIPENSADVDIPGFPDGRTVKLWSSDLFYEVGRCDRVDARNRRTCARTGSTDERKVSKAIRDDDLVYVDDAGSITYLSNDPTYLKERIRAIPLHGYTATDVALKYAYMLVDPAFQPYWAEAMQKKVLPRGTRPEKFDARPHAWDDPNTFKFIVVMTDGRIMPQFKNPNDKPSVNYGPGWGQIYNQNEAGKRFSALCENAKSNNVTVFTIGFDLGRASDAPTRKSLEDCATDRSHYFNVDDGNISKAFDAIAAAIQKVRLTS